MRGSVNDDLLPGLRHLALGQAIYWFQICAEVAQIRVLALFYGGQDQQRRMLVRLLGTSRSEQCGLWPKLQQTGCQAALKTEPLQTSSLI